MATDFVGTNTDKIDKLVAAVIELQTTMRICLRVCFAMLGVGFPLMMGLLTFLVVQSFSTAARVDKLYDKVDRIYDKVDRIYDKVDRIYDEVTILKNDVGKLSDRIDKLSDRMSKLERP